MKSSILQASQPLIRLDSCQRGLQIHGAQLVGSKLLRVSSSAWCPVLWKGPLVSGTWCERASRPALAGDEIAAHVVLLSARQNQKCKWQKCPPHTVLLCRHCTRSVFHLPNTPPEL